MKNDIQNIWTDKKRTIFGLPISFTRYFLTETKFIVRKGFLNLEETECDLYKVTDKKLQLPLSERIFGCGTIVMYVKDTDSPTIVIKSIKSPREVLALLDENINIQRDKYRVRGRDIIVSDFHGHDDDDDDDDDDY